MLLPFNLRSRRREPEIMDEPELDKDLHLCALKGLRRINRWSRSSRILWPALRAFASQGDRPLQVLDVATGSGDIPIALWRYARKAKVQLEISGCDINATAIDHARLEAERSHAEVPFFQCDILHDSLPQQYDVIVCSLFLHHLEESQAIRFLQQTSQAARVALLVNDLRRCVSGLLLAYAGSRLLTTSSVVHTDAVLSVRAAFTIAEVRSLAQRAGLNDAQIDCKWPFRFLLSWRRQ